MPNPQKGRSPEVERIIELWQRKQVMSRIGIDQLIAYIATLEAAPAWQGIESAPKDGTFVLCCMESGHRIILQWHKLLGGEGIWRKDSLGEHAWYPTHWMPLPAAPQIADK